MNLLDSLIGEKFSHNKSLKQLIYEKRPLFVILSRKILFYLKCTFDLHYNVLPLRSSLIYRELINK
eukprot:snap_masked-scaffold_5-processed-gene-4.31-mRNA-1 protein AED:1.00 eAED:1.00 QI:0/0/0/0/1/1/2/0/65